MELRGALRSSVVVCSLALAPALVAATACGGDGDDERGVSGTGDPIRDAFEVVEGSEMVGPAFPIGVAYMSQGEPVVDDGFRALFVVPDDPLPVIEGYLAQARDRGLTEVEGPTCGAHEYIDGVFSCFGFARTPDETDRRSLRLSFNRGRIGEASGFSHLEMSYSTTPNSWEHGAFARALGDAGSEAPPPPGDIDESVDGPLFAGWSPVEPVEVVEGSRSALQMPTENCTAFTPLAYLEVTGDPQAVLDAYGDVFGRITVDEPKPGEPLDVTGGRLLSTFASDAGGVSYRASVYDTDGTDWLLIDSCYD